MIKGQIVETYRNNNGKVLAVDTTSNVTEVNELRISLSYYSQALDKLGLYEGFDDNLVIPKRIFLNNMFRLNQMIYGNKPYLRYKAGLYADIVYLDFHNYYATVFKQIANHIDEYYQGKRITSIVKRKQFIKEADERHNFSKNAINKAPLVDINDIAKHGVKIDANDKSPLIELLDKIQNSTFIDGADKSVAKITRNALAYGFGYQQKNARVSNISAMVMFIASKIMDYAIRKFEEQGNTVIFSHTDSFMTNHFYTKELDDAIKYASEMVNNEYFGGVPIIHLDFSNLSIKGRFEDLLILNQNAYITSTKGDKGSININLNIGGLITTKTAWGGITANNEYLSDILSGNSDSIFRNDEEFFKKYEDVDFLYSPLKERLSEEYKQKIIEDFSKGVVSRRYIKVSKTIKQIGFLVSQIKASIK